VSTAHPSELHPTVRAVIGAYLTAVDEAAPGLVEGLYLTGSVALGEFRPRTSDIDFLAVTSKSPDAAAIAGLRRAHADLRTRCSQPFFDGCYVTWDDLSRDPSEASSGPYVYEGRLRKRGRGDGDPVTWKTVKDHGVCCRGPQPSRVNIWTDRRALTTWTLNNFDSYWRPLLARARRVPHPWSLTSSTTYGAVWIVLGVSRLHYTLATGAIASKEGAGEYALRVFPQKWHRVLNEALRIRRSDRARPSLTSALSEMLVDRGIRNHADRARVYRTPLERRREVLAFADMVIADATRTHGTGTNIA
jgi:hypothetical protein